MLLRAILSLLIFSVVLFVYLPARDLPFQFDDELFLSDDNVKLGRLQAFVWPPKSRPLTWISFLIQYQLHGPEARPYHLWNVALHTLNALLVFAVLARILQVQYARSLGVYLSSFVGSLVFALHPVQSEATLYIYQRSTLMGACFSLLTLLAFSFDRRRLALASLLLALLSKEFTVVLPVVLWLMNGFLHRKWKPDSWLIAYFTVSLLAGLSFLIWVLVSREPTLGVGVVKSVLYAATQVKVVWFYIGLTLFPASLNLEHDVRLQTDFLDGVWWIALLGLCGLIWVAIRFRDRAPEAAFFVSLFFVFLLPTSSLIYSQDYMFEHRLYASLVGFSGLITLLLWKGWQLASERLGSTGTRQSLAALLVGAPTVLLLTAYVTVDRERLEVWKDEVSLWRDAVQKSPEKYRPNHNLGVSLMKRSPREAAVFFSRAIALEPQLPFAYRSLGETCLALGNAKMALRCWKRALQLDPRDAQTHLALGQRYGEEIDYFPAYRHLKRAQELDPQDWRSYFHLAKLYFRFGFWDKALIQSEMGWNRSPRHLGLRLLRADSSARTGNWERAAELYHELVGEGTTNPAIYYKLAQSYLAMEQPERALATARQGLRRARSELESRQGKLLIEQVLAQMPETPGQD